MSTQRLFGHKPWLLATLCLLASLCAGCGYSMKSSLDAKYRSIHVEPFQNTSREYDMQAPLTNAVTRKFLNDGRLRVVQKSMADLVVTGTILEYELKGLSFDEDNETTQYEMRVRARVRVFDPHTGEVLWNENVNSTTFYSTLRADNASHRLRGNTQIELPAVRSFQTDQENRAASEALEVVAAEIFYRTIEPW